jgi:NTE family protein
MRQIAPISSALHLGAMRHGGANLVSYLLFDKGYCRALIELRYQDAMQRKEELLAFLDVEHEMQAAPDEKQ